MFDVINENRINQELGRIFRGQTKDDRIAKWLKKHARNFLKSRLSDLVEVRSGSPLARELPEWAERKLEAGEPVFRFALSHASEDQLSHVRDMLDTLLDEEDTQSGARKESAQKILNSLAHYDVRGAYELADDLFESMARHNIRHAGTSRNSVFAVSREDGEPVRIEAAADDLVWRQVVPRGLKTVAVALRNCLGGRGYANSVKNGHSEVWCLVNDVPDGEFDAQRDILMAAQIDLKKMAIKEAKGPGNRSLPEYGLDLDALVDAKGLEPRQVQRSGRQVLHEDTLTITHRELVRVGEYTVRIAKMPDEKIPHAVDAQKVDSWALIVTKTAQKGRAEVTPAGALFKNLETGHIALDVSPVCLFSNTEGVIYDRLAALVEGMKEVLKEGTFSGSTARILGGPSARDMVRKPPEAVRVDPTSLMIFSPEGEARNFMDTFVHEDGDANVDISISKDGVVLVRDHRIEGAELAGEHVLYGAARITAAASQCDPEAPVSRAAWRRLIDCPDVEPTSLRAVGSRERLDLDTFRSLERLDASGEMASLTMQGYDPISPVGFDVVSKDSSFSEYIALRSASTEIEEAQAELLVREVGYDGNFVQMRLPDGELVILASLRNAKPKEVHVSYGFDTFRKASDVDYVNEMPRKFQAAAASLPILRMLDRMRDGGGFQPFREATDSYQNDIFPQNMVRGGRLVPKTLKNLGTEETPIVKLDGPTRYVGIERGEDGSLEGGRVAWVAGKRPRGEITLQNLLPGGSAHLARTLEDRIWRVASNLGRGVAETLEEDGFYIANGAVLQAGYAQVTELKNDTFWVSRNKEAGGSDERDWWIEAAGTSRSARVRAGGPDEAKVDGKSRAMVTFSAGMFVSDTLRDFIVEVVNAAELGLDAWDRQMLGVERREDGSYAPIAGGSLTETYTVGSLIAARRTPDEEYQVELAWILVDGETQEPVATMARDGFHAQSSSYEVLDTAAEMRSLIDGGEFLECTTARETTPGRKASA
ncbi:hypothetical protein [Roseivivax sp. CAU 1761]